MSAISERYHAPDLMAQVEKYLPERLRTRIEGYYAQVSAQAQLDIVAYNDEFLANPMSHVAMYSDHGVVHVRDVAANILQVLNCINGVLIPRRSPAQLDFMRGIGVVLAYHHDIGMVNFSAFGRAMHPEFAAQEVFTPAYCEIIDTIWEENCGNLAWRLIMLANNNELMQPPHIVLRELLSLSVGHSKSKIPMPVLNDPLQLRQTLLSSVGTHLRYLYLQQQLAKAKETTKEAAAQAQLEEYVRGGGAQSFDSARQWYDDFERDAYVWLEATTPGLRILIADVIDVIRALRVADALRQRGTALRTSAGYQILVDQNTADAVFAIQKGTGEIFLVAASGRISAGEANIASSELTPSGDLRISFQRGAFTDRSAEFYAAECAALLVDDIQRDIVETFQRPVDEHTPHLKPNAEIAILLEGTDDNFDFADVVRAALLQLNPGLQERSRVAPSLKNLAPDERKRYVEATELTWSRERKETVILRVAQAGHPTARIDADKAFTDVRLTKLKAGDVLVLAGAPPGFVYIPMGEGLVSTPLGGYQADTVKPWVPKANTRLIRGGAQEATLSAQADVAVLMIPREVYLRHWHGTYSIEQFTQLIQRIYAEEQAQGAKQIIAILKQMAMIDADLQDAEVKFMVDFARSNGLHYNVADLRREIEAGGNVDFARLRQDVLDYLALKPAHLKVGQLRDLLVSFVQADATFTVNERLILSELMGILGSYLDDDADIPKVVVLIVPQNPDQDAEITRLLPRALKEQIFGGYAYNVGEFYSHEYAEMIADRYRALNLFSEVRSFSSYVA